MAYARRARSAIAAAVRARFDTVGFDPRGAGGSEPAVHCLTGPQLDTYFATDDTPTSAAQDGPIVAESRLFARGCEQNSGALLRYVGTRNAARDMDVLRAALGQAKLTYLGKSYGTYLGTWYARLFPSHVRALVLDGAIDPASSGLSMNAVQAQGFEVALRAFIANCDAAAGCPLRQTGVAAGLARLQSLLARATAHPLANELDNQPANGAMLLNGIATALYNQAYWGTLRSGLAAAFGGNGTVLVALANALFERSSSGQYSRDRGGLPGPAVAQICAQLAVGRGRRRAGRAGIWPGHHVGQPGLRILAGAVVPAARGAARIRGPCGAGGRCAAHPRRGHPA